MECPETGLDDDCDDERPWPPNCEDCCCCPGCMRYWENLLRALFLISWTELRTWLLMLE